MLPGELSQSIKSIAGQEGFDWCGISPAIAPPGLEHFQQWLEAGYHGQMEYLETRRDACAHPRHVMDGAESVVMLALGYDISNPQPASAGHGRVARYAWGSRDYHDVIHDRLKRLRNRVEQLHPDLSARGVVDTAPLLEREFAVLAGLGWQGKNTLVLNRSLGSWFFLAALLVNLPLEYDQRRETDHCGTCRACLDSCPTDAFVQPRVLDATKCISYLTIELRGPIPLDLRESMGSWVFGCDVCQDVCPWNRRVPPTGVREFRAEAELNPLELRKLFEMDDEQFRARFRRTPLWRSRRRGLLRNAAIVLGNQRDPAAIAALRRGLHDAEPLVRGASAWALGQIGGARDALRQRLAGESEITVQQEIELALRASSIPDNKSS